MDRRANMVSGKGKRRIYSSKYALSSMLVCPIIGLIGLILGVREKDRFFMALNVLFILLLPIAMFASHLVGSL